MSILYWLKKSYLKKIQPNTTVLCSCSGGLDSTVLFYFLKSLDLNLKIIPVHFEYGSLQNKKEKEVLQNIFGEEVRYINLTSFFQNIKSGLFTGNITLKEEYNEQNLSSTVVPFRNGIFLSCLGSLAENWNCKYIALASHNGDHSLYPDCRKDFTKTMQKAISFGTTNNVEFLAPFNSLDKNYIVALGKRLKVPLEKTYSCYLGGEKHCGQCSTCLERKQAFLYAGVKDLTEYEN